LRTSCHKAARPTPILATPTIEAMREISCRNSFTYCRKTAFLGSGYSSCCIRFNHYRGAKAKLWQAAFISSQPLLFEQWQVSHLPSSCFGLSESPGAGEEIFQGFHLAPRFGPSRRSNTNVSSKRDSQSTPSGRACFLLAVICVSCFRASL
jgi:hypothetical protein